MYFGLDQSYTGFGMFAFSQGDAFQDLGKFPPAKYANPVVRLLAIEEWVLNNLAPYSIDGIAMEGYANGATFGREVAGELGYAVRRAVWTTHGVYPTVVPPSSVKKFATGKGNAKKNEMLLAVYKRWGFETNDDNVADAYVLARIAQAIDRPDLERTAFQDEVLHKLSS